MTGGGEGQPGTVWERVTWLEMRMPPATPATAIPLPPSLAIGRADGPEPAFYRSLYRRVGEPWGWTERAAWTDAEIAATLRDPAVELWLLTVEGDLAGFAELDRRVREAVEIKYFGLVPRRTGQGFGPHLLRFAIRQAWRTGPARVWLHTSTLDHPAALGLYRGAGFVPVRVEDRPVNGPLRVDVP